MSHIQRRDEGPSTERRNRSCDLPRPRSKFGDILIFATAFSLFALPAAIHREIPLGNRLGSFITGVAITTLLTFVVEVVKRLLLCCEEVQHLAVRYDDSYLVLFKDVFHFRVRVWLCLVFAVVITAFKQYTIDSWYESGPYSLISGIAAGLLLRDLLRLQSGPLYESLAIENGNGLDYGSGMAHSFFHGYLKLVIPKTGTSEKHLEELMQDYEAKNGVKIEFYKLFILIPNSLYCPPSLMDGEFSPSIEESSSLPEKRITVAGVQNRIYKNSVYKINENNRKIYVSAEYATPLKTFYDVVSHSGEHSNYYKKHKNDIVLHFYLTLQKILNENKACTNYCELIFYNDMDKNGRRKDVGKIILRKIRKLKSRISDGAVR